MPARHVVVDGSNMATEGNSLPSLKQLDEAVREYLLENPDDIVTVVVDATFGHRIPPEERERFEQAELAGEIVSPPAGAIGRGDAFLLRVADKVGAVVLSNDSFQEFHGEYEWLFDKGRLIGGKPVPGVGWIFTPRTPVRGPKSRESVKEAKRKRHAEKVEEPSGSGLDMAAERSRGHGGDRKLQRAIAAAVEEAVEPAKGGRKRRRRRRGGEVPSEPLNEPFNFITFIAAHQLGDEVEGTVEEFSSHGAFISVDGARCYLPLSAMGDVPPRSAREVLRKGERRTFVVQAFDAMRRGIELALPGFARPAGTPTPETIDAEIHHGEPVPGGAGLDGTHANGVAAGVPAAAPAEPGAPAIIATKTVGKRVTRVAVPRGAKRSALVEGATPTETVPATAASKRAPRAKAATAPGGPTSAGEAGRQASTLDRASKKAATKAPAAAPVSPQEATASKAPEPGRPAPAKARPVGTKSPARAGTAKKQPSTKESVRKEPAKKAPAAKAPATKVATGGPPGAVGAKKSAEPGPAPARKASGAKAPAAKIPATKAPPAKTASNKTASNKTASNKTASNKTVSTKAASAKSPAAKTPAAKTPATKTSPAKKRPSPRTPAAPPPN